MLQKATIFSTNSAFLGLSVFPYILKHIRSRVILIVEVIILFSCVKLEQEDW